MNNRQRMYSSGIAIGGPAARPEVKVTLMPGILTPVQHGFLVAGTWGAAVLVFELILLLLLYLRGDVAQIGLPHVAIIFLVALAVSLWRFLGEYRQQAAWLRKVYEEGPELPLLQADETAVRQAFDSLKTSAGPPLTQMQARRPDRTIGRVTFDPVLGLTEAKIRNLAVAIASGTAVWSRRGLADLGVVKEEGYPKFCQTLLERGFLRAKDRGKGVDLTNEGRIWFESVAREAGLLPHPDADGMDE